MKLWPALAVILWASPASAATITNLSGRADTIDISGPKGFIPSTLERDQVVEIAGTITVRYAGMVKVLDANAEYIIWNNGIFEIQRHRK